MLTTQQKRTALWISTVVLVILAIFLIVGGAHWVWPLLSFVGAIGTGVWALLDA